MKDCIRLTREAVREILNQHEGFMNRSYYQSGDKEYDLCYEIRNGRLIKRLINDLSSDDALHNDIEICDYATAQKFLRMHRDELNLLIL